MIVARLYGRLGNQLFQYATARALALRLGVTLGLDTRSFVRKRRGHYGLDAFAIETAPLGGAQLPTPDSGWLQRFFSRTTQTRFSTFRERSFAFDPAVLTLSDATYLDGYFQSERYFADQSDAIRAELTVKTPPDAANAALLRQIAGCCAVSLHVRRGDYVADPKVSRRIGSLELDYYIRAGEHIAERLGAEPTFFAFSDDPDWVEANLRLRYPIVVVRQSGPAVEDLRLMAACRHHIVANSSFSWWGAWLNPSADKIVVAPDPWFRDTSLDTRDLIPESWSQLPASLAGA